MSSRLDAPQIIKKIYNDETGNLEVEALSSGVPFTWDYLDMALSAGNTVETYTYRTGGSGGTVVGTAVVTYTTSDRDVLVSVEITKV
jgi:hypothetical protein